MSTNNKKYNTIFIGTSDFGVPALEVLIEKYNVKAVITQRDKKVGRKQIVTPPPIKTIAQEYNTEVWQPEKIKDTAEKIKNLNPDFVVVAAYAQIIPREILDIPKYGFLNIHASLLPKYRGASCIQAAILAGDTEIGVSIMKMDKGLDTGPILAQKSLKIGKDATAGTLFNKLSILGRDLLINTLDKYLAGKIEPIKQNNKKASYVSILNKKDGQIDWQKSALEIEKFIRAMHPWPGAFSYLDNKIIKIIDTSKIIEVNKYKPGELFLDNGSLAIQCKKDALVINTLQLEGKKEISARDFLLGYRNKIGKALG